MTLQNAGTFLTRILDHKRAEVARQSAATSLAQLQAMIASAGAPRPFGAALRQPGRATLIAEVKQASPSKGVLVENFDPLALAQTYAANGAAAISVLTDEQFFGGSLLYLQSIRRELPDRPPLLRKDFIIDPYQVYQARAYGADALLLIVAALGDRPLGELLALAHELGMQALVEVHDVAELDRALAAGARIVGVNNRNLHTFETTLATTRQIAERLPAQDRPTLVSESGISTPAHAAQLCAWGADAILVGEALVTAPDTAACVRALAGVAEGENRS